MQFYFSLMSQSDAEKIADWHYEGIYSFYDMENDPEDLQELLSPENVAKITGVFFQTEL